MTNNMHKKYLYILPLIFLLGCVNGIPALTKKQLSPGYNQVKITTNQPIILTNKYQIINQARSYKISVNSNNITINIPSYTNTIDLNLKGIEKSNAIITPQSLFVYYFLLIVTGLIAWYIWNKYKKKKCCNSKEIKEKQLTLNL